MTRIFLFSFTHSSIIFIVQHKNEMKHNKISIHCSIHLLNINHPLLLYYYSSSKVHFQNFLKAYLLPNSFFFLNQMKLFFQKNTQIKKNFFWFQSSSSTTFLSFWFQFQFQIQFIFSLYHFIHGDNLFFFLLSIDMFDTPSTTTTKQQKSRIESNSTNVLIHWFSNTSCDKGVCSKFSKHSQISSHLFNTKTTFLLNLSPNCHL